MLACGENGPDSLEDASNVDYCGHEVHVHVVMLSWIALKRHPSEKAPIRGTQVENAPIVSRERYVR